MKNLASKAVVSSLFPPSVINHFLKLLFLVLWFFMCEILNPPLSYRKGSISCILIFTLLFYTEHYFLEIIPQECINLSFLSIVVV